MASATDPLGHTTTLAYDAMGNLTTVTDSLGKVTTLTYDAAGRPVTVQGPLGQTVQVAYEGADLRTVTDPLGRARQRAVDALGRVRLRIGPQGQTTRLAYDVPAGWNRLEADIALDDAAGLEGSAIFKVVVESGGQWQAAYESPIVRGGDAPLPVKIDLKGVTRAALLVEYADRGDVLDHANWLNVRLVK